MPGRRLSAISHVVITGLLTGLVVLSPEAAGAAGAADASVPATARASALDLRATTAQTQGRPGVGGPVGPQAPEAVPLTSGSGTAVALEGGLSYRGVPDRPAARVEVSSERSARAKVYRNADGTKTVELHPGPIHFRTSSGTYEDIDTTLVAGPEGLRPRATQNPVVFASTTTGSQLAVVSLGEGRSVSWTLSGAGPSAASSDGRVARYAGVLAGVDLELAATYTGVKEDIIVHRASAATTFEFPLALTALTARTGDDGIELVGLDGEVAATIPKGYALDAANARTDNVGMTLVGSPAAPTIRMSLDPAWLADPSRAFPVRLDPTLTTNTGDDTYVTAFNPVDHSAEGGLEVGANYAYGVESVMLLKFPGVSALTNKHIISSNLGLYQTWAYGCVTRTYGAFRMTQDWNPSTVQYGDVAGGLGYDTAGGAWEQNLDYWGGCGRGQNWVSFGPNDLAKMNAIVSAWAHGEAPNYGFAVRAASTSDTWSNRTYASMNTPYGVPPTLSVTYSDWGATYSGASWATVATPSQAGTLNVTVRNTGSYTWPANGTTRLSYHLRDNTTGSVVVWDGPRTYLPQDVPPNATITLPMAVAPQPAGDYRIELDMVQDGVTWFSSQGVPTAIFTHRFSDAPTLTGTSPSSGAALKTTAPTLSVSVQNPDSFPAGNIGTQFTVCTDPAMTTACTSSGWLTSPSASAESTTQTWSPAGITWETPYWWQVKVQEQAGTEWPPTGAGTISTPMNFRASIAQPDASHLGVDPHGGSVAGINPYSRNAMVAFTDIDLPGAGPQAGIRRTYNSADGRTGVFGLGWSSMLDMRVSPGRSADYRGAGTADSALVTFADGRSLRFPRNADGSLSSPFGMADKLSADATGFTYTDADATVWGFDQWGRLSSVTDRLGLGLTVTKPAGVVPLRRFVDCPATATACTRPDPGSAITRDFSTTATFGPNPADAALFNSQDIAGLWSAGGAGYAAVYSCGTTDPVLQTASCAGGILEGYVSTTVRSDSVALYNCAPGGGYTGDNFVQTGACERGLPTLLGYAQLPSYQGGKPTEVRNTASGRALALGWDPSSYLITSVATPTVAAHGGPLTWTYAYDGPTRALNGVCGPSAVCTTYTNTSVATTGGIVPRLSSVTTPEGVTAFKVGYAVDGGVAWREDPAGNRWSFETRTNDALLADNPSGYWRLAEASGPTAAADIGADATYANTSPSAFGDTGANIGRGDVNPAVTLDGVDDSIALPSGYAGIGTTGFSFTAWVKPTDLAGTRRILELGVAGTSTGLYLERTSSGALTAGVGDGSTYKTVTTGPKLVAGTWARITLTVDPTGDTRIYVGDIMAKGKRLAVPANVVRSNNRIGTDGTTTLGASIDEVATFANALSATRIKAQLSGRRLLVTEPALAGEPARSQSYVHDVDGRLTSTVDQAAATTTYAYDSRGFLAGITDPNGNATTYVNDAAGRPVQTSVKRGATTLTSFTEYCVQGAGACSAYPAGDLRLGRVLATRDARSASATDDTYRTTFGYDTQGRKTSTATPPSPGFPSGRTATTTYTGAGSDPAIGGGYAPAGLIKTSTDPAGAVTTSAYDAKGDLRRVTAPSGAVTDYTYDELGRLLTTSVTADSVTTAMSTVAYDAWSRPITETAAGGDQRRHRRDPPGPDHDHLQQRRPSDRRGDLRPEPRQRHPGPVTHRHHHL